MNVVPENANLAIKFNRGLMERDKKSRWRLVGLTKIMELQSEVDPRLIQRI